MTHQGRAALEAMVKFSHASVPKEVLEAEVQQVAEYVDELERDRESGDQQIAASNNVIGALEKRVAELETKGSPGVMHAVDHAFYQLAISERNAAWAHVEELKQRVAEFRDVTRELISQRQRCPDCEQPAGSVHTEECYLGQLLARTAPAKEGT